MASIEENYSIVLIDNEDEARRCAEFLADEFARNNPLSICMESSSKALFDVWLGALAQDSFHEKLSFMVRHRQTNEIIAAILANDLFHYCQKHPYDSSEYPSSEPVSDFLDEMRQHFVEHELGQPLRENLVLNIAAGGTNTSYASRGIAMKLRKHLCDYARDHRGFQCAFVQTAHPATRHIYAKKMNGKVTGSVHPRLWFLDRSHLYDQACPLKNYRDEPIDNVLVQLNAMNLEQ